jgi:hypothetical protein
MKVIATFLEHGDSKQYNDRLGLLTKLQDGTQLCIMNNSVRSTTFFLSDFTLSQS